MGFKKDDISLNSWRHNTPEKIEEALASGELDLYACGHLVEYDEIPYGEFSVPFLTDRMRVLVRNGPSYTIQHMTSSLLPLAAFGLLSYIR